MHKHHIVPRFAGGSNDQINITPPISLRLHAALHWDRWKHCGDPRDRLACLALLGRMTPEEARIEASRIARWQKPFTDEHRAKLSQGNKNRAINSPESYERGDRHWSRRMPWRVARGASKSAAISAGAHRGDSNPARRSPELVRAGILRWLERLGTDERKAHFKRDVSGSRNPRAKLSQADVVVIRARSCGGESASDLAAIFGVTAGHIRSITKGIRWAEACLGEGEMGLQDCERQMAQYRCTQGSEAQR